MILSLIKPTDKPTSWYIQDRSNKVINDEKILKWIESLVIPPAWQKVQIDTSLQAVQIAWGYDLKNRQQVIYSKSHIIKARKEKYCNLVKFGETLPKIMADIDSYLKAEKFTKNKIIALTLKIVDCCSFRLGTLKYEHGNNSYGITTITPEHLTFEKNGNININFVGKKGVENDCTITDPLIVTNLKKLSEIDKKDRHIMTYQEGKEWFHVKHTEVNYFLNEYGENFTSKDFRTFRSNTLLIDLLRKEEDPYKLEPSKRKKQMNAAILEVSALIHNTKAIAQKDYIDPEILQLYMEHPIAYRSKFITPKTDARILFINWLKLKCC